MTGNINLQYFTSSIPGPIFLISDFENLMISLISNKISVGVRDLATVGDPSTVYTCYTI